MAENDEREPETDEATEAPTALPDLDVTDESGDAVKGGVPKIDD